MELAWQRPDRVRSLVLVRPAYRGFEPTEAAKAFDVRENELLEAGQVEEAVELNVATWLGPEASEEWRDRVRAMQRHALAVHLAAESGEEGPEPARVDLSPAEITAPTVVVRGDLDMDHFRNIAVRLSSEIPGCRLVTLPWAAHLPSLERPDETSAFLADALG